MGRPPLGLKNIMTRISTKLIARLDRIKRLTGMPRSKVMRIGIEKEVTRIEKDLKKTKD